jgi:hypothetical protein
LYFDEDVDGRLAAALQRQGFRVVTTAEAGRLGAADEEQLAFAAAQEWVLVTRNVMHFPAINEAWLGAGREHWGIVVVVNPPNLSVGLRRMRVLLSRHSREECRNQLLYLGAEYDEGEPP